MLSDEERDKYKRLLDQRAREGQLGRWHQSDVENGIHTHAGDFNNQSNGLYQQPPVTQNNKELLITELEHRLNRQGRDMSELSQRLRVVEAELTKYQDAERKRIAATAKKPAKKHRGQAS